MKRNILKIAAIFAFLTITAFHAFADDPDGPPNPGGDPGTGGGVPVGAPIDGGIAILLLLGTGYGGYKIYKLKKQEEIS